ncbi:unnamed protein product [Diabrotica balteata]|uniref:Chitin-binding type-2 domain-containing protein n=1 Tax=Diabrotica balteata TaxID=107213 RepID=A0A9P0E4L6_DIABA|nr:unnamed protein product [Diabrotica balteata]
MMGVNGILCTLLVVLSSANYCTAFYNASHELYTLPCNQDDLNYRAYPYDCHKYIACEDNALVVIDCPEGFIWSEDRKACDFPENAECHEIPFPEPDCSDGKNTYWRYPFDCSLFWECLNKQLYLLPCPDDYFWDDSIKKCDVNEAVDCSGIIPYPSTSSSEAPATTTDEPLPYTTPEMICTKDNTFFPNIYDCSKYYECSNGIPVPMSCPAGEMWNIKLNTCDWAANVDCSYTVTPGTKVPPTSPVTQTPEPETPTAPTTSVPYTTPDLICTADKEYFPYIYDCSKYYECSNGVPILMDCPTGELWNIKINNCDWPANVDCSYVVSTTANPSSDVPDTSSADTNTPSEDPTEATTEPIPYTTPDLICTADKEYFPYIYDCSKYYECSNGIPVLMDCPTGELWNIKINNCDWPANVDCSYVVTTSGAPTAAPTQAPTQAPTEAPTEAPTQPPTEAPTEAPTQPPTDAPTEAPTEVPTDAPGPNTTPEIICKQDNTYFPYMYDCAKYYECSNGKPILMTCPTGQLWNNLLKTCDWAANVDCSYIISTPAPAA